MRFMLIVLAMAVMVGCSFNGDRNSKSQTTEAQHAACRAAEFDHAAMRLCASDDLAYYYCLYCVDKRGVMYPFEERTEVLRRSK